DSTFRSARFLAGKIRYQREPYCGSREEFPVATVYGDVNELELRKHSPPRRGGVDATLIKCCEASFVGADGVVSSAKCSGLRVFADLTTLLLRARLRGIRWLRSFFDRAASLEASPCLARASRPPLRGEELCSIQF